jgi:hypothetical protein
VKYKRIRTLSFTLCEFRRIKSEDGVRHRDSLIAILNILNNPSCTESEKVLMLTDRIDAFSGRRAVPNSDHIISFLSRNLSYLPGVYSASNRNEYQKRKNNNVSGE